MVTAALTLLRSDVRCRLTRLRGVLRVRAELVLGTDRPWPAGTVQRPVTRKISPYRGPFCPRYQFCLYVRTQRLFKNTSFLLLSVVLLRKQWSFNNSVNQN